MPVRPSLHMILLSLLVPIRFQNSHALQSHAEVSSVHWSDGYSAEFELKDMSAAGEGYSGRIFANILSEPRAVREEIVYPDKRHIVYIWRQDTGKFIGVDTAHNVYWQVPQSNHVKQATVESISLTNIPHFIGKVGSTKFVGHDLVDGRSADHWKLTAIGGASPSIWDYWEDIRIHTCVRAELPNVKTYRLSHIEEGKQRAELFSRDPNSREISAPNNLPTP